MSEERIAKLEAEIERLEEIVKALTCPSVFGRGFGFNSEGRLVTVDKPLISGEATATFRPVSGLSAHGQR